MTDVDVETLEQYAERINDVTFREVVVLIADRVTKLKQEGAVKSAIKTFVDDLFSLRWDSLPAEMCVNVSNELRRHTNTYIVSARKEVTRKCPPKEKLWVALRGMGERCRMLQNQNDLLSSKIEELEAELQEQSQEG